MTPRQHQILKFVNEYITKNRHSPSYKQIQEGCHINSYNSVSQCVNSLDRRGYITKVPYAKRSLRVTEQGRNEI